MQVAEQQFEAAVERRLTWGLAVIQLVLWGVFYYAAAALLLPMEKNLGWSRGLLLAGPTLALVISALASPIIGILIDGGHGRRIMLTGTGLGIAGLVLWATAANETLYFLAWTLIGLAQAGTLYEPAFAIIMRNCKTHPRRAITRISLVGGLAGTVFVPLGGMLESITGWRPTVLLLACIVLFVILPLQWLALDGTQRHEVGGTLSATTDGPDIARPPGLAARNPVFWAIMTAIFLSSGIFGAVTFHIVPLLEAGGVTSSTALLAFAFIGPSQVAGRLALLLVEQKVSVRRLGLAVFAMLLLATIFLLMDPACMLYFFPPLYGISIGLQTIARPAIVADFMGRRDFGQISGLIAFPATIAKAISPLLIGLVWEWRQDYMPVKYVLVGTAVLALLSFILAVCLHGHRHEIVE